MFRVLECGDLCFIYNFNNNCNIMFYWFEEFYEFFDEFEEFYNKYIYDNVEWCFVVEDV